MKMKMNFLNWMKALMLGSTVALFAACSDSEPLGKGDADFEITDAPSDDASIKGVFVTVTDLRIDGKSVSGFTKQTIDLKAYQDGRTKLLGTAQLDSKTYGTITMVLDLNTDAEGNSPGCYVLTQDDAKFKLRESDAGKIEINLAKSISVKANGKVSVVMDFDLRKSIQYSEDAQVRYRFAADDQLKSSVRIVAKENSGMINGTYSEQVNTNADMIVVYAYKKGTFNATTETQGDVQFKNAIASAQVKEKLGVKSYVIAWLESGDYELHFVSYKKNSETGRMSFSSTLESETSVSGSVSDIVKVNAGATVTISSLIKAVI